MQENTRIRIFIIRGDRLVMSLVVCDSRKYSNIILLGKFSFW